MTLIGIHSFTEEHKDIYRYEVKTTANNVIKYKVVILSGSEYEI